MQRALQRLVRSRILAKPTAAAVANYSSDGDACAPTKKGLVLGVYRGCSPGEVRMSDDAQKFDLAVSGRATDFLLTSNIARQGVVVAHDLHPDYFAVAFADIGPMNAGYNKLENLEECLEWTRTGAGVGARALQKYGVDDIYVENMSNVQAAAEGAVLGAWDFDGYKVTEERLKSQVLPHNVKDTELWRSGTITGEAQNLARHIAHLPPNVGTPEGIADYVRDVLCKCSISVTIRNVEWIEEKKLNSLLSVAMGSRRTPIVLEMSYCGGPADEKPAVLIGDGCTYDSWGLCLRNQKRPEWGMYAKSGAASVIGAMKAVAQLSLPLNVNALVPLYENKPGGMAMKPGSVIKTYDEKTTEVHRTNVSSRLVLSDIIGYSQMLTPNLIISVSSLSNDTQNYLNGSATFGFTTEEGLYNQIEGASASTGDRVVRGPLWNFYKAKTLWPTLADTRVVPYKEAGDAMAAAMFLEKFKPKGSAMITLDVGGSAFLRSPMPEHYLRPERMTGSPVRTIVQLLKQTACPNDRRPAC
ncbi:cytosol aminopeptidase-like [Adelges cooleyi]|uniref:cytosol aminopeptidase-like n=1 Tax=Adelges cooleyi TaxID=133065 RepID=UPI00217F884C|nr:cytosol aminopeptidase-like [Adelges cooleyi]